MTQNKLRMNDSKTEFLISRKQTSKVNRTSINVDGDASKAKTFVRYLGSMFDTELKMTEHVSHVLKVGYFQLRQLRPIRKYLMPVAATISIHASVI